jgi:hypothetical protein
VRLQRLGEGLEVADGAVQPRHAGRRIGVKRRRAGNRLGQIMRHASARGEQMEGRAAGGVLEEGRFRRREAAHRKLDTLRTVVQGLGPAPFGGLAQPGQLCQPLQLRQGVGEAGQHQLAVAFCRTAAAAKGQASAGGEQKGAPLHDVRRARS